MKRNIILFGLLAAVTVTTLAVRAYAGDLFAGTGTEFSKIISYYVAPHPGTGGRVKLNYVNATGDGAACNLLIKNCSTGLVLTNTQASVTNFCQVGSTAVSFASNDVAVLYHVSAATYERVLIYSGTAGGLITFSANSTAVPTAGDVIYEATTAATIPVGAATKEINAGGGFFFIGTAGLPVLVETTGAANTTNTVNAVGGEY